MSPGLPLKAEIAQFGITPIVAFHLTDFPEATEAEFHSVKGHIFCHEDRLALILAMPLGPAVGWARPVASGETSRVGPLLKQRPHGGTGAVKWKVRGIFGLLSSW